MTDPEKPNPEHSLARLLYEANPVAGWNPHWDQLDPVQRLWWTNYERMIRQYIESKQAVILPEKPDTETSTTSVRPLGPRRT